MSKAVGQRVAAIMDASATDVRLFGYGTYVGDEVPPPEIQFMGMHIDVPNPKIVLDDGKVVWGCECWWGPEEETKAKLGSRTVTMVDIEKARLGEVDHAQG